MSAQVHTEAAKPCYDPQSVCRNSPWLRPSSDLPLNDPEKIQKVRFQYLAESIMHRYDRYTPGHVAHIVTVSYRPEGSACWDTRSVA